MQDIQTNADDEGSAQTNFGGTSYKSIGGEPQVSFAVKFELPQTLTNKVIHEAKLTFFCWSVSNYTQGNMFKLCDLTEAWDENTATWNQREAGVNWSVPGGTYCTNPVGTVPIQSQSFYPEFDVTALVQQWVDHSLVNNGLILINDTATITGIKASEYSEYGRPSLVIQYSENTECLSDKDSDSDVDGMDLALLAVGFNSDCLEMFAGVYGNE